MRKKRRRKRCRYYVNTNFVVDLLEKRREAIVFAVRHRGTICSSRVLLHEFKGTGKLVDAKRILGSYGITVYKLGKRRAWVAARVEEAIAVLPRVGPNTLLDWIHIFAARALGAKYFVTADRAVCKRAIRAGLCCINYREGGEEYP